MTAELRHSTGRLRCGAGQGRARQGRAAVLDGERNPAIFPPAVHKQQVVQISATVSQPLTSEPRARMACTQHAHVSLHARRSHTTATSVAAMQQTMHVAQQTTEQVATGNAQQITLQHTTDKRQRTLCRLPRGQRAVPLSTHCPDARVAVTPQNMRACTDTDSSTRPRTCRDASVQARGHTVVCTARCAPELGDGVVGGVHCARTLHACTKAVSKAITD